MPVRATIRVKSNKQIVKKSKEDLRAKVPKVAKSRMKTAATDLKNRMKKPGRKVKYPINWDSVKQKFKVIIKLRKAKNLPYHRTKKSQQGWKVVPLESGYTVENRVRGAKYVYGSVRGNSQSSIHTGRWPYIVREADIVIKNLPAGMLRALTESTRSLIVSQKVPVR